MSLYKVIWTALTATIMAAGWLFAGWMHSVDDRQGRTEERLTVTEQHYSAIEQHLLDIGEDLRDIKDGLAQQRGRH